MKELTKYSFLWMAEGDLKTSEQLMREVTDDTRFINIAGFHIQQAIEKCIKFQLERAGIDYANNSNLYRLYLSHTEIRNRVPFELREEFPLLAEWKANTRYNKEYAAELSSVKRILAITRSFMNSEISREIARQEKAEKEKASLAEVTST